MTKQSGSEQLVVWWIRRDLRIEDNVALFHALQSGIPVLPVFIFDTEILDALDSRMDRRVVFIHQQLQSLKQQLEQLHHSTLHIFHGDPRIVFEAIVEKYHPVSIYANEDYEPYGRSRDQRISAQLKGHGIELHLFKDHVIYARNEIAKADGTPYTVFTPYSKQWLSHFTNDRVQPYAMNKANGRFYPMAPLSMPSLSGLGFIDQDVDFPGNKVDLKVLLGYHHKRDFPSAQGTSRLGVHLRFGTIGIRQLVNYVKDISSAFLNELIWREFFQQILWHFPDVMNNNFKSQYDLLEWRNNEEEFNAWCSGNTGYPLVDAGMRELNATGLMHNRIRMIVASFLTKHLLIDWRWGEAYFAEKLLDFELASNNGNWQWAAGTGCDAAPYFRIFNPTEQARRFDKDGEYVRKWISELGTSGYPLPIVDHKMARERALKTYKKALSQSLPAGGRHNPVI